MDNATVQRLNDINREFYRVTADDFDQTRQQPWPGWERLLPYINTSNEIFSVLDVGCGNGRFGVFLAKNMPHVGAAHEPPSVSIVYRGIDNNATLLSRARESLAALPNVSPALEEIDVLADSPPVGEYDLVALFGVLHHVPGIERRKAILQTLADRLKPDGLLAFACWRFYEEPRWRERIAPWPDELAEQVETGDYLLDWRRGETALRYCHYVDDAEHDSLVAATGLNEVVRYRADGAGGSSNCYSIIARRDL